MKLCYDLHIHSCASPCADDEMTPNNIVNMALVSGLDIIALTDHNTCANCPAFLQAAKKAGLTAFAGMELTTSEEIHVICIFEELDNAMRFSDYVYGRLPDVRNNPSIFGNQLILDASDAFLKHEERLLINAAGIGIHEISPLVRSYGGICYPAHIDRNSYSILSVLGAIPPEYGFCALEVHSYESFFCFGKNKGLKEHYRILTSSDAHSLSDIALKNRYIKLASNDFVSLKKALGYF